MTYVKGGPNPNPDPTPEQREAMASASRLPIPTPTPYEAMILRGYDSGMYDNMNELVRNLGAGGDYARVLDNYRPQWRTQPWRDAARWHVNRVSRRRGGKSAAWVSRVLRRFEAFRAERPLTPALLDDWMRERGNATPSSINRWATCMRTYIRDINAMGWLPEPLDRYITILSPIDEPPKEPLVMTPDQLKALLTAATAMTHKGAQGTRIFILASLILGTRTGETLLLKGRNVFPRKRMVEIPPFKQSKLRRISYQTSPLAVELFAMLYEKRQGAEPLCKGATTPQAWKRLLGLAGLPNMDRRVLRATARSAYSSSAQLPEAHLRRMFGHSTDVADKHYLDDGGEWKGAGDCIEQLLGCEDELAELVRLTVRVERRGYHELGKPAPQPHAHEHPVLAKQV